jgi:hypothetical protein
LALAGLSVLLLSVGCVRSVQPVLKDDQVIVDKDLAGKWVSSDGKDTYEVSLPTGDDKTYQVRYIDVDDKESTYLARLGKVQNLTILEAHAADFAPQADDVYRSHFLGLYSFLIIYQTKPNLIVSSLDMDWLRRYLEDHPTELQFFKPDEKSVVLNSTPDEFQKFLLKHQNDEGAIGDKTTLAHPGDPTTRAAAK